MSIGLEQSPRLELTLRFFVAGEPVPQGSSRMVPVGPKHKRRFVITSDNRNLGGWRQRIATEAQAQRAVERFPFLTGPVRVRASFHLPRPASLPRRVERHVRKPDLDKLARALLDGITGVLIEDDARIDDLHVVKVYARVGEQPGAWVTVIGFG